MNVKPVLAAVCAACCMLCACGAIEDEDAALSSDNSYDSKEGNAAAVTTAEAVTTTAQATTTEAAVTDITAVTSEAEITTEELEQSPDSELSYDAFTLIKFDDIGAQMYIPSGLTYEVSGLPEENYGTMTVKECFEFTSQKLTWIQRAGCEYIRLLDGTSYEQAAAADKEFFLSGGDHQDGLAESVVIDLEEYAIDDTHSAMILCREFIWSNEHISNDYLMMGYYQVDETSFVLFQYSFSKKSDSYYDTMLQSLRSYSYQ